MKEKRITINGKLLARKKSHNAGILFHEIVKIEKEFRPKGPAENSILVIQIYKSGDTQSNYIPWVGYFDVDREVSREPAHWEIIEPSKRYRRKNVIWKPFL